MLGKGFAAIEMDVDRNSFMRIVVPFKKFPAIIETKEVKGDRYAMVAICHKSGDIPHAQRHLVQPAFAR